MRFLILLLRMLTARTGRLQPGSPVAEDQRGWRHPVTWERDARDPWIVPGEPTSAGRREEMDGSGPHAARGKERDGSAPRAARRQETDGWAPRAARREETDGSGPHAARGPIARRRRVPRWLRWAAVLALVALVFRKVIAFAVLVTLSAALHLIGLNVHLPSIRFAWPWQSVATGTTTDTGVGPWVLQKIEGISRPALGTENFNFVFTHKVSKSIGLWPCWYSSTFYAVGRASATVDLNPGPGWWAPSSGHYRLQVLSRPADRRPGRVTVAIVLPAPQLPRSVDDITVDDTRSRVISTDHSWTYPGFGCGALLRPQFSPSVLYGQAQSLAFYQATHNPRVTRPLIGAAETEATLIIRDDFVQPTVNALGYTLADFSLRWSGAS